MLRTNFLGGLAVTEAMLPLLHNSAAGRIVGVQWPRLSCSQRQPQSASTNLIGYRAAKAALNMLAEQLARLLSDAPSK
ncbi:MAG: SDR family NAD(P)-dependent oxidoreductase [Candidatus Acidiferrales bacterium]